MGHLFSIGMSYPYVSSVYDDLFLFVHPEFVIHQICMRFPSSFLLLHICCDDCGFMIACDNVAFPLPNGVLGATPLKYVVARELLCTSCM